MSASKGRPKGAMLWPDLFEWVNNTGMDTSDFAVEVAPTDELGSGEYGLIAKSDLEPGDILVWAPTSLLLTKKKAVALWGDIVEPLQDRIAIALLLIHERIFKGEESVWSSYWESLPSFDGDVAGPSFLWSEEEWQWLEGSDGYPATIQMHNAIIDDFDDLSSNLFSSSPADFPSSVFTYDNYRWACAVVASRAYGDDAEGTSLAIAPLVDFLNHRAGALQLTRFSNGIVAYAHKRYEAGDQVWVSYGGKSNAQLLSQYGFVDDDNMEEAVYLRIGAHFELTEPHLEAKRALLEELLERDPESGIFKVARRPREWESQLLPAARALALAAQDNVPARVTDLYPIQVAHIEAAAYKLIDLALERRTREYPANLQDDRSLLKASGLPERNALGLRLRISEQELIALARVHVQDALNLLGVKAP